MKKILFYTLMLCLSSFALTSCNDDNDELTDAKVHCVERIVRLV